MRTIAFLGLGIPGLLYLTALLLPLSPSANLALGVAACCTLALISLLRLQGIFRQIFLAIGATVIIRYIYWRATSTLPPTSQILDFTASLAIFSAELFCVITFFLSVLVAARPITRAPARKMADADLPTVDVFIPTYNEDYAIVATTLHAARKMVYPADRLTIYLLDDGGTDQKCGSDDDAVAAAARARRANLTRLCQEAGAVYHARAVNEHAKAGNLNAGLAISRGELVVVFDADHAPARNFLTETIGYFAEDRKLFLVQTPHFFLNPDPIERNLNTFETMPSENEMFYGVLQKGLDNWNSAFFCGSAAVLRRRALETVGGFSGLSITEDCETALELHSKGWNSLYVDKPMIAGLQPESFTAFIGQRSRWCQGMIQILLLKNPLLKAGLRLSQRLCYLSNALFWFFPLPRAIFLVAPLLFILFDMQVYTATAREFLSYTTVYILAIALIQNYIFGRVCWTWISEVYEYVQTVYLFRAVLSVIAHPRQPTFKVTAKGDTIKHDRLSEFAWPFYLIFAVLAATTLYAVHRYLNEPEIRDLILVVAVWNAVNLMIAGLALGVVSERRERRGAPRVSLARTRAVLAIDGEPLPVVLTNMSMLGVQFRLRGADAAIRNGKEGVLVVAGRGEGAGELEVPIKVVFGMRDDAGLVYGASFVGQGSQRFQLIAGEMFGDLGRLNALREARRRYRFLPTWTLEVAVWSIAQTVRGLRYLLIRQPAAPSSRPVTGARRGVLSDGAV